MPQHHPLPAGTNQIRIGFLLVDGFSMLCVAAMINPFRSANRELREQAFVWDFVTLDDQPCAASDGLTITPTAKVRTPGGFDYFFVVAGLETDPPGRAALNAALQRIARQSRVFGALCTAPFMLARAGFLDGYDFTLHWENQPAFREEFPDMEPSGNLYVLDRDRWTGSGGLSSMDIALQIIATHHGLGVAQWVGNQYQIDRIRNASIGQRPSALGRYETLPPALKKCIATMSENMETPLSIPQLARGSGMTVRSLERMFARHLEVSPAKFYRSIRLEQVRHLIWHTNLSVLEIAVSTGFPSPSHLTRLYVAEFGVKPSQDRKERGAIRRTAYAG